MSEKIYLTNGAEVLVDSEDYEWLSQYSWWSNGRYAITKIDDKMVKMHKLILPVATGMDVDHKDGNRLNNTKDNLRPATRQQNCGNRGASKNSRSKYKGVYFDITRGKWRSQIMIDGKNKHVGYFESEEAAALAYNERTVEVFGEFARLNIV